MILLTKVDGFPAGWGRGARSPERRNLALVAYAARLSALRRGSIRKEVIRRCNLLGLFMRYRQELAQHFRVLVL